MEIKKSIFVRSSGNLSECPKPDIPEYAFIGRSNVGKSSLINMLCNHKELARTSSNPGKTIAINHFLINDKWYIVDLPGYGYAKRSKELRTKWEEELEKYLRGRENLQCVFVLIDSRIEPQTSDLEFVNFLGKLEVPMAITFTKIDKLNQSERSKNIKKFTDKVLEYWEELPPVYQTSAIDKKGKDKLLKFIDEVNKTFVKPAF